MELSSIKPLNFLFLYIIPGKMLNDAFNVIRVTTTYKDSFLKATVRSATKTNSVKNFCILLEIDSFTCCKGSVDSIQGNKRCSVFVGYLDTHVRPR
jgi:hypothetical protein